MQSELLTVAEVAAHLRVAAGTVYAMIAAGRLAAIRVGVGRGHLRVSAPELTDYLTRSSVGPCRVVSGRPAYVALKTLRAPKHEK